MMTKSCVTGKAKKMFRQILVPLDGSERGDRALPVALLLAEAAGATLHLVRVVEPPLLSASTLAASSGLHDDFMASEGADAAAYLARVEADVNADGGRRKVHAVSLSGNAAAMLLDYERDAGIDLVVLCSHGCGGLARFILGSVAERLLRHGAAPTLVVAAWGPAVVLTCAVVPLDGSVAAEEALRTVDMLAGAVVRKVLLLRAVDDAAATTEAERYLQQAAAGLTRERLECQWRVTRDDPAEAIVDAAGADALVVMTAYGHAHQRRMHSSLAHWALGSVADRVAHGGTAGVLVVRSDAAPQSCEDDHSRIESLAPKDVQSAAASHA